MVPAGVVLRLSPLQPANTVTETVCVVETKDGDEEPLPLYEDGQLDVVVHTSKIISGQAPCNRSESYRYSFQLLKAVLLLFRVLSEAEDSCSASACQMGRGLI